MSGVSSMGLLVDGPRAPKKKLLRRASRSRSHQPSVRRAVPGAEPGGHEQSSIVPEGPKSTAELVEAPPSGSEGVPPAPQFEPLTAPPAPDISRDLGTRGCPVCDHLRRIAFDFLSRWQYALSSNEKVQAGFVVEIAADLLSKTALRFEEFAENIRAFALKSAPRDRGMRSDDEKARTGVRLPTSSAQDDRFQACGNGS